MQKSASAEASSSVLPGASLVGFAATTDTARSRAFYQGQLGLHVLDPCRPHSLQLNPPIKP